MTNLLYLCMYVCMYVAIRRPCVHYIACTYKICDRIWENPAYSEFYDFLVSYIFDKLYHRANPRSSFRAILLFVVEIQRFVCDRATPPIIEKLRSKGVAMHAYHVSAY